MALPYSKGRQNALAILLLVAGNYPKKQGRYYDKQGDNKKHRREIKVLGAMGILHENKKGNRIIA